MEKPDRIAAIATGLGRAAVGVVRISGAGLDVLIPTLVGKPLAPRRATLCSVLDARGEPIDSGIAIFFPAPHSYTGEDVLEIQGHGGSAVLHLVLGRCLEVGARLAEPGEFTRRAFLNGKLDLAQAEAVADLIEASSALAARCALKSLTGVFSTAVSDLQASLTALRIRVEATIDFPEEDLGLSHNSIRGELETLMTKMRDLMSRAAQGKRLRDGLTVAIVGAPNVGKSSLLNYFAGEPVAIVTEVPGTTRDLISVHVAIQGVPMMLVDTAGIRESTDIVENIGISRALEAAGSADIVLNVVDALNPSPMEFELGSHQRQVTVLNKVDLLNESTDLLGQYPIHLSARTGDGVEKLKRFLVAEAGIPDEAMDSVFLARQRHVLALEDALAHLQNASGVNRLPDLVAEELRLAHRAVGRITGQVTADDLLGQIFSTFCIGK